MDSAIAQPDTAPTARTISPNMFTLRNRRVSVTFSATSITGQPLLHYRDRQREVSARGDEIRQVETEIGNLVTITLEPDADAGSLLFSVLIPRAALADPGIDLPIATQGVYTRSRLRPRLPASVQLQTYEVVELKGSASFVVS